MKKWLILAAMMLGGCTQELNYQVPADDALATIESVAGSDAMEFPNMGYAVDVAFENVAADRLAVWTYSYGGKELGKLMASVEPAGDAASKVKINFVDGKEALDDRGTAIRRLLESDQLMLAKEAIAAKFENRAVDPALKKQLTMDLAALEMGKVLREMPQMQHDAFAAASQMDKESRDSREEAHDREQERLVNPNGFGQARP
ncbi:hypothetical protein ABDK56_06660 [Sphingomonas sp. ASV193]|uniref:hypothetical protein n=1 Tax=Sphingomonas sp. ASV193 TaxID=3144405 RepID=UPI0032E91ADF